MVWQGSYFICVWKVKKCYDELFFSCFTCFDLRQTESFSVTDPFLTTFYYVKKRNGILRKNRRDGFENLTYAYMGVRGVKNCQKKSLGNNEWPPRTCNARSIEKYSKVGISMV